MDYFFKKRYTIIILLSLLPFLAQASKNKASDFVGEVKSAADADGKISSQMDISCPVDSASGKIFITKVGYEINDSNGVYIFSDDDSQARLSLFYLLYKDDDSSSGKVTGASFIFKMNNGQFFIDVMKNGKVRAGVNTAGKSGVDWIECRVSPDS